MSEPDTDAPDLSLATSKQLLDELAKRASAFVVGFDPLANKEDHFYAQRFGDVLTCCGLVRRLEIMADEALMGSELKDKDEDDER